MVLAGPAVRAGPAAGVMIEDRGQVALAEAGVDRRVPERPVDLGRSGQPRGRDRGSHLDPHPPGAGRGWRAPFSRPVGALARVMPTAGTSPVSRSRSTCRLYPPNSTERDLRPCRISASSMLIRRPMATPRRKAPAPGQIGVLVPYLPGGRHRSGRGLVAGLPGGERFHPVQQGTCPKDGAARPNS